MSLDTATTERPVHFPADPTKFGFDKEVSAIFPDMARRSIPNFYESHAAHAAMLRPLIEGKATVDVLDIGASRGAFFDALYAEFGTQTANDRFALYAIDNSPEMCELLATTHPYAGVECLDITTENFWADRTQYDVVCCHYVLQFLPRDKQQRAMKKVFAKVKPGGVLIFGHKSMHYGALGAAAHEQYIRFRLKNGYTREEIEAKTKALKGSMNTQDHELVLEAVHQNFTHVQETFRFMMFSTFMAVK